MPEQAAVCKQVAEVPEAACKQVPVQLQQEGRDLVDVLRVGSLAAPVTLVETRAPGR